jgi:hypothetical protein
MLDNDAVALVRLMNADGRVIKSQMTSGGKRFELHTSNLTSGLYFLQVVQDGQLYVQRLVIH